MVDKHTVVAAVVGDAYHLTHHLPLQLALMGVELVLGLCQLLEVVEVAVHHRQERCTDLFDVDGGGLLDVVFAEHTKQHHHVVLLHVVDHRQLQLSDECVDSTHCDEPIPPFRRFLLLYDLQ